MSFKAARSKLGILWSKPGVKIPLGKFKEAIETASGASPATDATLVKKFLQLHNVTKGMLLSMTIKGLSPLGAPAEDAPEEDRWAWACESILAVLVAHVPSPTPPPSLGQPPAREASVALSAAAGGGGGGSGGGAHEYGDLPLGPLIRAALLSSTATGKTQTWTFKPPSEGPRSNVGWTSDGLGPIKSIATFYAAGAVEPGARIHFDSLHTISVLEFLLHRFANPTYLMNSHFAVTSSGSVNVSITGPQTGFTVNAVYNLLSDAKRDWERSHHAELVHSTAPQFKALGEVSQEARARAALGASFTILTTSIQRITNGARVFGVDVVHAAVLRFGHDLFISRFCYLPKTDFDVTGYAQPVQHAILQNVASAALRAAETAAAAALAAAAGKRSREREREHGGGGSGNGGGSGGGGGGSGNASSGGSGDGGGSGREKRAKSTLPEGWDSRAYFDLPDCLRPDNWAKPLGADCCAVCGARNPKWNTHGPTSQCPGIPSASGGGGTGWRTSPRFNAFNKESFPNAFNIPAAGQSAKDANPGVEPPGKDWRPRRNG